MEQPFWVQDPSFFYFTSLLNAPGAILLLDAPKRRSILFSGPDPAPFGIARSDLNVQNRPDWVLQSGVSAVLPNSDLIEYIESRLSSGVRTVYLDGPRREAPNEAPPGLLAVSGFHRLWEQAFRLALPNAQFESAIEAIGQLRWIKSSEEIEQLRFNALASASALQNGMTRIQTATNQREAEAAVVAACLESGAEGPSFWPWVMTGPNAHIRTVVGSFFDSSHLNRPFHSGELVRVDVGCAAGGYGGDVGRTVPVSGTFSESQSLIWDALVSGYLAGIDAMKDGVSLQEVELASQKGLLAWSQEDPNRREIATRMNGESGVSWHLHGVGIESGETSQPILRTGSVIAFEPMFSNGEDAYYLEDMILIGPQGAEVLTPGLPYWASEMAQFLAKDR
ncbi:aminopeptidase P family protein [bacterium]|nr:aminopeptidase P family protein [bacterium]